MQSFTTTDITGTTTYNVIEPVPGHFTVEFVNFVPHVPLTPAEQAEADAEAEMFMHYCEWAEGHGGLVDPYYPHGFWRTPEAAKRACELFDAMHAAVDFDAPAYAAMQHELRLLESQMGMPDPFAKNDPYAERGLENPTRPLSELLPNGGSGLTDNDIIALLGERQAR